jgi:uncharacterized membrane protein YbhN (UPF0104 family)
MIAAVMVLMFYGVLSVHWLIVCRLIDTKTPQSQMLSFFASQPYKYLPTSIFTFSSRARFSSKLGMSLKKSSAAQLIENFNLIGSALGTGAILLVFQQSLWAGIAVVGSGFLLTAALWEKKTIYITKLHHEIALRTWLMALVLSFCSWLIVGLGFAITAQIFGSETSLINVIAANSVAFGASIIAVFAPGGLGVRETIFTYFSVALGAIVMWRLITIVIDALVGVIAAVLIKSHK